jgi:dynein heavy chain 2
MTIPDNDLIAEVLLASEGFSCAKALASKLVALYKLAQEGLSRQQHYDWGLRALKAALGAAGRLLRQVSRASETDGTL